jgi:hypothetical protein
LYVGASRWAELAALYERRAAALGDDATTLPQRIELLLRAAHLLTDRLHRGPDAVQGLPRAWDSAWAPAPTRPEATCG